MRVRWDARLLNHPQLETVFEELRATMLQRHLPIPPAGTPLAIGDTIITTTAHNMIAVDFRTGKRIWQTEPQRVAEFELLHNFTNNSGQLDANIEPVQVFSQRLWDDYLYNSVSSDGERVFAIRDLAPPQFNEYETWAMPFRGGETDKLKIKGGTNRLCAYDLRSQGKLIWELDGAAMQGELAGAYFLGVPVPVEELLYALVEVKSAIHLVSIDRHTGQVKGVQELAGLQSGILNDPERRLQAAMPSYDAGILVCPTCAGVVIGINLELKSFAWAYRYPAEDIFARHHRRVVSPMSRWLGGSAIISKGNVLLTPTDSNSLVCLDLATGDHKWTHPRGDGIFVAGVDDDRVVIVGEHSVIALNLADGKRIWSEQKIAFSEDVYPSGRGFFSHGKYFLPLSNATVVGIDLTQGEIVAKATARGGAALGNVVAHQGSIISCDGRSLKCFDQIDVLRKLTEEQLVSNPEDHDALRTLGEITYNTGNLAEALDLLEKSFSIEPQEMRTREVLGECLLEALQKHFASYQDRLPRLHELLNEHPEKHLQLQQIEAAGLLELKNPLGSLDVCLKIFESQTEFQTLLSAGDHRQATIASWLQSQVNVIWQQSSVGDRKEIVNRLTEIKQQFLAGDRADARDTLAECFGALPGFFAVEMLAQGHELALANSLLASQQTFLKFVDSEDTPLQGEAIASCGQMLHEHDLGRLAASYDVILNDPLADVECLDGKTGKQLVAGWGGIESLGCLDWPYGKVNVQSSEEPPTQTAISNIRTPLAVVRLEHGDGVLANCDIFYSSRVGEIVIRDSSGQEVFRQTLGDEDRQVFNPSGVYGVSRGNLLVLSLGQQVMAIDTLALKSGRTQSTLWRKSTVRSPTDRFQNRHSVRNLQNRPGSNRPQRTQIDERWIGVLSPLSRDGLVYQDQRGLTCVDPLTGRVRWSHANTPNACELFGDDRVVVALENNNTKAQVYSVHDGRSLGEVEVPLWKELLTTRGTDVIAWRRNSAGQQEMASRNVLSGESKWTHVFDSGSVVDVGLGKYLAVVEPTGRYVVVDLESGKLLVDYTSQIDGVIAQVHLFQGADCLTIAVEQARQTPTSRRMIWANGIDQSVFDGELMSFGAQSGQPLWSRPAQIRNQSLLLTQPVNLPVIAFVGNYHRQDTTGRQQFISLMLLEKSSGRVLVWEDELPASPNYCDIVADAAAHEVRVEMASQSVKLSFTDAPRPPEPPASYEAATAAEEGPRGLYRILQRIGFGN